MMWLGIDSIRSKPVKPELYSTIERECMYIPDTDKIIKIGNSEFTGTLKTNDYFIMVDDSKFNYAADWSKEIQKARDVSSDKLRQARQEGYAQGVEAQKKSEEKKIFLRDFIKLYCGNSGTHCSLYVMLNGVEEEFIGVVPMGGKVIKSYENYILNSWHLSDAGESDIIIYLEVVDEDD